MNPELQRNLWLEITLHRLLLVPGVIFTAAALLHAIDPSDTALNKTALFSFVTLTMVWGARQAANSVLDEARARTWDIQRMCALSPWRMTWGKLCGATVMSWLAGLCCLLIFLGTGGADNAAGAGMTVLLIVAVAVLTQAAALIGALVGLHRGSGVQSRFGNLLVVALLMFMLPNIMSIVDPQQTVHWYTLTFRRLPFATVAATLFAAWAVLGALRAMCMELKIGTRPWAWLAFAPFITFFISGFAGIELTPSLELARCLFATLTLAAIVQSYLAAFAYPSDPVQLRRSARAFTGGHYRRALEELPLWLVAAALAVLAALTATALGSAPQLTNQRLDNLGPVSLAAVLMMLRDLALLSYFGMTLRPGRAEATTLVYIVILDGLLPALLPHLGLGALVQLLWPPFFTAPFTAIAILAVHFALVLALPLVAYRRLQGALNETSGG